MRKIILQEMISIDGYFAGLKGEIDWHVVDEDFNRHAIELLKRIDTILFGRITYQLFENYWPAAEANLSTSKSDVEIAKAINNAKKIVFSKSMYNVTWNNSILMNEIIPEKIYWMKQQSGKDLVIFGSGSLIPLFIESGLIDEYWIFIAPVILGSGKTLFAGIKNRLVTKLGESKVFKSGNVLLKYNV